MPIGVAEFIKPPSPGGLILLKYLLFLALFIHFPYICMVIGGSTLSVFFNILDRDRPNANYRRFARELADTVVGSRGLGLLLGVLPMITVVFLLWQLLYGTEMANMYRWWMAIALLFASFLFLYTYQGTFRVRERWFALHIGCGVWGLLLLFGAYLVFMANKSFILYPELWKSIGEPVALGFSSNYLPVFLYFIAIAFALTGGAILLFLVRPALKEGGPYPAFARKVGLWLILLFVLAQPVFSFVELVVLPEPVLSYGLLWGRVAALFTGMLIALCAALALMKKEEGRGYCRIAITLLLASVVLFIMNDNTMRENVLKEHMLFLEDSAIKAMPARTDLQLTEVGRKIYETTCVACHSLDGSKLLGPSFKGIFGRTAVVVSEGGEREITVDENYLIKSLNEPAADVVKGYQNLMPPQKFGEKEIEGIVEYLKTLK